MGNKLSSKKYFTVLTLIFIFIFVSLLLLMIFKNRVGDIRPALLPPRGDIAKIVDTQKNRVVAKVGTPVEFPLKLPSGFEIGIFAKSLGKARDLEFSPGGTLILSIPESGKVVALPDKDNDGKADEIRDVLTNLNKPHGIAFFNAKLFVAEETRVVRYKFDEQNLTATLDKVLFSLPKGGNHKTRTIAFDKKGRMFVSLGSTCNVCLENHPYLAAVIVSDQDGNYPQVFAKGLRNAVFITVNPNTSDLWGVEMGRDFLGDNLPPDEINIIRENKDYGWPICFGNRIYDKKFGGGQKDYCDSTQSPIYEIPAHSAPLGLTFIRSEQFPKDWQGDLLVSYHGSWNRSVPTGYKVVRLKLDGNKVVSQEDFISGFWQGGEALGRPVDVIFDQKGSLFISDDKKGAVYNVIRKR